MRAARSQVGFSCIDGLGETGACYTNVTAGDKACQAPSFTPIFSDLYDDISLPTDVASTLTTQFPFSPTFLFISLCLMFIQLAVLAALALGCHKPQGNLGFIARKQHRLVRVALIIGVVSLALGLAATGALRVICGSDVKAARDIQGVEADIGSGFARKWVFPEKSVRRVEALMSSVEQNFGPATLSRRS